MMKRSAIVIACTCVALGCKAERAESFEEYKEPLVYAKYDASSPPSEPPRAPSKDDYEALLNHYQLPTGWMLPAACYGDKPRPGLNVGLQYSGLYFGTETLAVFPSGDIPEQGLEALAARLQQASDTSPHRVNLYVHPATPMARLQPVLARIRDNGWFVDLAVRDRLFRTAVGRTLRLEDVEFHEREITPVISLGESTKIGILQESGELLPQIEVANPGTPEHDDAIRRYREEVLDKDFAGVREPIFNAEPHITFGEIIDALALIQGLPCYGPSGIIFEHFDLRPSPGSGEAKE